MPVNAPPVKAVPVKPAPVKAAAKDGPWRIQLGAFGDEGNAKKLWSSLEAKVSSLAGFQPYLTATGRITRLQAGPFPSRAAAESMCSKVKATGQACIPVPR